MTPCQLRGSKYLLLMGAHKKNEEEFTIILHVLTIQMVLNKKICIITASGLNCKKHTSTTKHLKQ